MGILGSQVGEEQQHSWSTEEGRWSSWLDRSRGRKEAAAPQCGSSAMAGPITALMGVVLGALFSPMGTFNIHPTPQQVLEVAGTPSFGYGVLMLSEGWVVVGAPNVGRLYGCQVQNGECREVELWGNRSAAHMGMALSRDGNNNIACGPGLRWECNHNIHVGGVCTVLDPELRPLQVLEAGYQGWVPSMVDPVFLFDGSGSLKAHEFKAIRDFMVEVMEQLSNSSFRGADLHSGERPPALHPPGSHHHHRRRCHRQQHCAGG
ncbi:integrin alpha-L-like isoform X2 [Phasianus colchicus]|uniref:integrin alpha-L-like isoform X2 n=1 Tax=Phasianus colchicus TaxID=9054 RepID=UPI00129E2CA1|nr:integrin alpha-L-like isoform X2 [Phasianus colchicus]